MQTKLKALGYYISTSDTNPSTVFWIKWPNEMYLSVLGSRNIYFRSKNESNATGFAHWTKITRKQAEKIARRIKSNMPKGPATNNY